MVTASAPSGKRAERNRRAILDAATELFIRDGYDVGMDAIAARAQVSKVTIYNHFTGKAELFTAVVDQAREEAQGSVLTEALGRLGGAKDVGQALLDTARALVAGVTKPSVLALRNLVTGELRRFPELGEAWRRQGPDPYATRLGEAFSELTRRGELVIADIEVAVIQFTSLTLYPHLIANSFGATYPPELTERLLVQGVETFLSRYRAAAA